MPETLTLTADAVQFQCRHIRPDGRRCGSPSLRNGNFCYHHDLTRRPGPRQPQVNTARAAKLNNFDLPSPADLSERAGLQLAIGQVLGKIANNEIDPRRAGLLLYGLQIASQLLPKTEPAPTPEQVIEDVVQDPDLGALAPEAELTEPEPPVTKGQRTLERWLNELNEEAAADAARKAAEPSPTHALQAGTKTNRAQRRALLSRLHRQAKRPNPPRSSHH